MRLLRIRMPRIASGKSTGTPKLARATMTTRLCVLAGVGLLFLLILAAR